MYSIAAIINGKDSEDAFTVHRYASSAEQMHKILDALIFLGASNISVTQQEKRYPIVR